MPVEVIPPTQATGRLKEIYDEITRQLGKVPFPLQVLSARPGLVEIYWRRIRETISQSLLSRRQISLIAFEVAKADGCGVCKDLCSADLRDAGMSEDEIKALEREIKDTRLDERTKNLLMYSYQVASDPHNKDKVVALFKGLGLSDEDIVETASIVSGNRAMFGLIHSLGFHST